MRFKSCQGLVISQTVTFVSDGVVMCVVMASCMGCVRSMGNTNMMWCCREGGKSVAGVVQCLFGAAAAQSVLVLVGYTRTCTWPVAQNQPIHNGVIVNHHHPLDTAPHIAYAAIVRSDFVRKQCVVRKKRGGHHVT